MTIATMTTVGAAAALPHPRRRSTLSRVRGATIAQEREYLHAIRRLALDVDAATMVSDAMSAQQFAFEYVRNDRTKRQANIARSKERRKRRDAAAAAAAAAAAETSSNVGRDGEH